MGAIIGGAVLSVLGARRIAKKRKEAEQLSLEDASSGGSAGGNEHEASRTKPKKRGFLKRLFFGK